jgi:hypothetical protein
VLAFSRGQASWTSCESLAEKILRFRRSDGRFEDSRRIPETLAAEESLSAEEQNALRRVTNHGLLAVQSSHFCGISSSVGDGGDVGHYSIEFVIERRTGVVKCWYEY